MYDSKFDTRNNQINYRDKINSKLSKNISLYRTSNKFENLVIMVFVISILKMLFILFCTKNRDVSRSEIIHSCNVNQLTFSVLTRQMCSESALCSTVFTVHIHAEI